MFILLFIGAVQEFGFIGALAIYTLCAAVAAILYMAGHAVHTEDEFELHIDFKDEHAVQYLIIVTAILFDLFCFATWRVDKIKTAEYKKGEDIGYEAGYAEGCSEAEWAAFENGKEAGYEEFKQEFNHIFEEDWDDVRP